MNNPVLILSYNALPLLKRCVESVRNQDAPTQIVVLDNGSSDGSREWIIAEDGLSGYSSVLEHNIGVSAGWNYGLKIIFGTWNAPCCLVLNQDTVLPTFFYRELAASGYLYDQATFVTGTETKNMDDLAIPPEFKPPQPSPDFSAFLIGKTTWNRVGPFDESLKNWCGDIDYHVRAHRLGINLWRANVLYFHDRSYTIRNAPPKQRKGFEMQGDVDRLTFAEKWNAVVGSPEHKALFSPENFGIDAK